ncbi:hypothetical protein, partial [Pseudomonas sp. MT4]|uniref:hypothetical protein n=1 Tax=Pseudomonas sp. MT4 TaxID=2610900 RepID=UPI001E42EA26
QPEIPDYFRPSLRDCVTKELGYAALRPPDPHIERSTAGNDERQDDRTVLDQKTKGVLARSKRLRWHPSACRHQPIPRERVNDCCGQRRIAPNRFEGLQRADT